jgi:hypothetical protein
MLFGEVNFFCPLKPGKPMGFSKPHRVFTKIKKKGSEHFKKCSPPQLLKRKIIEN